MTNQITHHKIMLGFFLTDQETQSYRRHLVVLSEHITIYHLAFLKT